MGAASTGIHPPTSTAAIDSIHDRVTDLERRTAATVVGRVPPAATIIHYIGPLAEVVSDPWPVSSTGRLAVVRFKPAVADPDDDTILEVYRNGEALTPLGAGSTTITIPADSTDEVSIQFGGDDHLFGRFGLDPADELSIGILSFGATAAGLVTTSVWT